MLSRDLRLNAMLHDYAAGFAEHWVEAEGSRLHWLIGGAGPPLVLLHGDYGSWTHWTRNLPGLSARYRVLVPDLPGYGSSEMLAGDFSEQRLARSLRAALCQLVPDDSYRLAGFSFGGIVAGHLAAQDGGRVSHLLVSGPGGLGAPHPSTMPTLERSMPGAGRAEAIAVQQRNLTRLMIHDPKKADELAARIHLENIERTRTRIGTIPRTTTLLAVMPLISARLSAIWGGNDRYSTERTAVESERLMRRFHPGLDFRVIDGVGHWAPYENPGAFERLLFEML